MTPIKALADAAREVLDYAKRSSIGAGDWVEATLAEALAAYDAAQASQPPSDAEIESFIANAEDECFELLEKRMSRYGLWREVPEEPTP